MKNSPIPIGQKYMLSISEAAEYFNIGTKKIRSLANANMNRFAITMGNRILIVRERFEEYIKSLMDGEEGKDMLNPAETIEYFGFSKRKFDRFLNSGKCDAFIVSYNSRKLILREKFEQFLNVNKQIKEELKNGRKRTKT